MFAKIENNQVVKYPIYSWHEEFPNASIPTSSGWVPEGYVPVLTGELPDVGFEQKPVEGVPEFKDGSWYRTFVLASLTAEELAEKTARLKSSLTIEVQQRLDAFAKTRNYDSILSACTYATSTNPAFAVEGQRCVELRDATWKALYVFMERVQSKEVEVPRSVADLKEVLPELKWV